MLVSDRVLEKLKDVRFGASVHTMDAELFYFLEAGNQRNILSKPSTDFDGYNEIVSIEFKMQAPSDVADIGFDEDDDDDDEKIEVKDAVEELIYTRTIDGKMIYMIDIKESRIN